MWFDRICARRSKKEFLQVNRAGTGTIQRLKISEDIQAQGFRSVLSQTVCKTVKRVSILPWFTCKLWRKVKSFSLWLTFTVCLANNVADYYFIINYILSSRSCTLITWMWSWTLNEINVGHLRKGKLLSLLRLLLLTGSFFKKKVVAGGKIVIFVSCSQDKFCHYFILCTAAVCCQIMLAKNILSETKIQEELQGSLLLFEVESEILKSPW